MLATRTVKNLKTIATEQPTYWPNNSFSTIEPLISYHERSTLENVRLDEIAIIVYLLLYNSIKIYYNNAITATSTNPVPSKTNCDVFKK